MRLCVKLLTVSALIAISTSAIALQSSKKILEELFTTMAARDQFNGTVLVAEKGQIMFSGAYGKADMSSGEALTTNSVFELGYITKQFTAMAIMMLEEEGKLEFSQDISLYFPDIPYKGVTVKHLLTHTSGIPCYYRDIHKWPDELANAKHMVTNQDIMDLIYSGKPMPNFNPGDRWAVSNTNYCLLALLVEKTSGKSFSTFIDERIFKPLEMTNSYCHSKADGKQVSGMAVGYEYSYKKSKYVEAEEIYSGRGFKSNNAILGTHGIKSTVEDLFKWDRALTNNKLVKAETLKKAFNKVTLNNGRQENYGFGWEISSYGDKIEVSHDGAIGGYLSYISRNINKDRTIIYLRNKASYGGRGLKRSIEKAIDYNRLSVPKASLTEYLKLEIANKEGDALVDAYSDFSYNQKEAYYYSQIEFIILIGNFLEEGEVGKAESVIKVIETESPNSETYMRIGEVYERNANYHQASVYYKKALELDSNNTEASQRLKRLSD